MECYRRFMCDKKLVSVIITKCDRPISYLKRAVRSVLEQTYPIIELLIIDTGKHIDETYRYVDSIANNYNKPTIVKSYGTSGSIARNIGASLSKGTWLAFLDDDDEWASDKLEKQLELFDEDTSLVYSNYIVTDSQNNQRPFFSETPDTYDLKTKILGENVIGCTSMPIMTRQAFIDAGGFNESFKANQEWDLWIRILQNHNAKYSPNIAGIKHYCDDRISSKKFKRLAGWISLFIHHAPKYYKNKEQLKTALGFFIGEMFDKRMFLSGITALPLYVILKRKYEKSKSKFSPCCRRLWNIP